MTRHSLLLLAITCLISLVSMAAGPTLNERLGYASTDRLLIVNGDDAGMCHAANEATIEALEKGLMTSATLMVPCPWFEEIADYARRHPGQDFGVHLCHTAEWKFYRWGPVADRQKVPGLLDKDGYLWRSIEEVYTNATPGEALEEGRAQVRKALAAGVDLTHLDSHMGTLQLNPAYLEVYLKLAVEFDLPVRMASQKTMEKFGQAALRQSFAAQGIVFTDDFVYEELSEEKDNVKAFWTRILKGLKPGVTELYIHAAMPGDELKAITGSWRTRGEEFQTFGRDPEMRRLIQDENIKLIGYRPLRELQHRERKQKGTRP